VAAPSSLDSIISLAKRRGFVFQSGEIYGGSRSAWDYGPLGVELKENIRRQWWQTFVRGPVAAGVVQQLQREDRPQAGGVAGYRGREPGGYRREVLTGGSPIRTGRIQFAMTGPGF